MSRSIGSLRTRVSLALLPLLLLVVGAGVAGTSLQSMLAVTNSLTSILLVVLVLSLFGFWKRTRPNRATEELRRAEERYRGIFENAVEGIFQSTPDGQILTANQALADMLGYDSGEELIASIRHIGEQVYLEPAQREELRRRLAKDSVVHGFELLCARKDKTTVWLSYDARAVRDASGAVQMYEGFVSDVSARKNAEQKVRRLAHLQATVAELGKRALRHDPSADIAGEAVSLVATALEVDLVNVMELKPDKKTALLRAGVGWTQAQVGVTTVDIHGTQAGFTLRSDRPVMVEAIAMDARLAPVASVLGEPDVASSMSVAIPMQHGVYGTLGVHTRQPRSFSKDEIDFVRSIANVLGAAIERSRAEQRLQRVNRAHRALSACNHALVRAHDEQSWITEICRVIVEDAGYRLCWVGRAESDEAKSVRVVASAGFDEGYLEGLHISWADNERGRGPTGTCIRTGKLVLAQQIASDPAYAPWRARALERGYASSIAVPIIVGAQTFGALNIYASEPDAFAQAEVVLLSELADDLAYGIGALRTRAERDRALDDLRALNLELEQRVERRTAALRAAHEREASIGARIQRELLLDAPPRDLPGLQVAALVAPSQHIAGDFYGFFRHEDNDCVDVLVADVMGKGVPAALLAAAAKSHFPDALWHLMADAKPGTLPEPHAIVTFAHTHLVRQLLELESFVTACYARIDVAARRLQLVDCGHTGLLHFRPRTGACEIMHGDNLPLGVRAGEIFQQISAPLEVGDVLVFYSDGVSEARNSEGEMFGAERLVECVREHGSATPEELVEQVRAAVAAYSGGRSLADDLTCLVARLVSYEAPSSRAELAIASKLSELQAARRFVASFCRGMPDGALGEDDTAALVVAVNEAACNVMKHAYQGREDQQIEITAEAFHDRVTVRLRYQGAAFEPASVPPPDFEGSREGGFGVFIIARSVDAVRYYRDDLQRCCIRLEKRRTA